MALSSSQPTSRPFHRILIANRGEIAVRVARACRSLGLSPIAVYSEADRRALHVREADEAYLLGPAPANESYLAAERLLAAAGAAGADAVHPGYGFLSESPTFARAVEAAGPVWVGPPPAAMAHMGDKAEARRLAAGAGVPVLPGYDGPEQDPARLLEEARQIGWPLLIKAVAGGGGRGMRRVEGPDGFPAALAAARREAEAAFGDRRLLLEKVVERPRHVEIQILADRQGHVVHLGERECSIQRRHQKLIEESPSPALDPDRRRAMGQAAVAVARAAGYTGAGTVEFLLDTDGRFYFLEMNTRIQVEHPVTEAVTGLDLVVWQLRIAAGEPLPFSQEELRLDGHAIECRLYAEDPARGFLPSSGRITTWNPPVGEGIRIDSGVAAGDEVTPYYDGLLAKLILHGRSRSESLDRLHEALAAFEVDGVTHNLPFLRSIVAQPAFRRGELSTAFIEEQGLLDPSSALAKAAGATAAARALFEAGRHASEPFLHLGPWRQGRGRVYTLQGSHEKAPYTVELDGEGTAHCRLAGHGREGEAEAVTFTDLSAWRQEAQGETGRSRWQVRSSGPDGETWTATIRLKNLASPIDVEIRGGNQASPLTVLVFEAVRPLPQDRWRRGAADDAAQDHVLEIRSPLPGKLVELRVQSGTRVEARDVLAVLEAMKMEHTIPAPGAGRVLSVEAGTDQVVGAGDLLLRLALD